MFEKYVKTSHFLQMPYVQTLCLFVEIFLDVTEVLPADLKSSISYYLDFVMTFTFLCAMWGCFLIIDLTAKFKMIEGHKFIAKAALLKSIVGFVNLQFLIINILVHYEIIECKEYLSNTGYGGLISNVCSLLLALILGNICFYVNMIDHTHH